jgi:hypothetical protein
MLRRVTITITIRSLLGWMLSTPLFLVGGYLRLARGVHTWPLAGYLVGGFVGLWGILVVLILLFDADADVYVYWVRRSSLH